MAREQFTATNGFSLRANWEDIQSLTSENEIISLAWEKMTQSLEPLSLLLPPIPSLLLTKHAGASCQIGGRVLLRCGQVSATARRCRSAFVLPASP